jgi:hypothetical protein
MTTIQEGPGGLKTNVLRKPTDSEIELTQNKILIPEEGSVVNRVGRNGYQ